MKRRRTFTFPQLTICEAAEIPDLVNVDGKDLTWPGQGMNRRKFWEWEEEDKSSSSRTSVSLGCQFIQSPDSFPTYEMFSPGSSKYKCWSVYQASNPRPSRHAVRWWKEHLTASAIILNNRISLKALPHQLNNQVQVLLYNPISGKCRASGWKGAINANQLGRVDGWMGEKWLNEWGEVGRGRVFNHLVDIFLCCCSPKGLPKNSKCWIMMNTTGYARTNLGT